MRHPTTPTVHKPSAPRKTRPNLHPTPKNKTKEARKLNPPISMENPLSEANPHSQTIIEERGKRIKLAAEIGLARSSNGRLWARALRRRLHRQRKLPQRECIAKNSTPSLKKEVPLVADVVADVAEEKEGIEDRVRALQRLVPGGEEMEVDRLFEETADYIEALREQVGVMRALACLLNGMESRDGDKL